MGVRKGTDNFAAFRELKSKSSQRLVVDTLERLRKRKLRYPSISTLVADIAEKTGIHRTTLMRNPEYKRLILTFLASQPGASASVSDDDASPELLRAKLFDTRLEAKNLRSRIAVLELQVQKLTITDAAPLPDEAGAQVAFANTVALLKLVLERINKDFEVMKVDFDKGEIRDLAASSGRQLVADGPRARSFIQAYQKLLAQEKNNKPPYEQQG